MQKRLFEIKTLKSVIIKNLFEVIKPYIKETNLLIHPEYIKMSTLDISEQSVTYFKLNADKFESYICEEPIVIGIDTTLFFKIIKSSNRRETITLFMDDDDTDKLGIELNDVIQGKIKHYKINLLDLDKAPFKINDMEFDYIINLPTTEFQKIIKDIHTLDCKKVEIKSIGKQLIFSCVDGPEFTTTISEIDEVINKEQKEFLEKNGEDCKSVKFVKKNNTIVQGIFKMSYLMSFIKASHLCDNMNLYLANDCPLILEYFVADLGHIRFILFS